MISCDDRRLAAKSRVSSVGARPHAEVRRIHAALGTTIFFVTHDVEEAIALADRVLVKPLEEKEVKKGGIIIPDSAKEKPQEGEVVALGTGKTDDEGKKIAFTVKKGDRVLISKYGGTEIKLEGENYLIMREDDILGILG